MKKLNKWSKIVLLKWYFLNFLFLFWFYWSVRILLFIRPWWLYGLTSSFHWLEVVWNRTLSSTWWSWRIMDFRALHYLRVFHVVGSWLFHILAFWCKVVEVHHWAFTFRCLLLALFSVLNFLCAYLKSMCRFDLHNTSWVL